MKPETKQRFEKIIADVQRIDTETSDVSDADKETAVAGLRRMMTDEAYYEEVTRGAVWSGRPGLDDAFRWSCTDEGGQFWKRIGRAINALPYTITESGIHCDGFLTWEQIEVALAEREKKTK